MDTSRRSLIGGGLAITGTWLLGGCVPARTRSGPDGASLQPTMPYPTPPRLAPAAGGTVVEKTLRAAPTTVDLGGLLVDTWAYSDVMPGPGLDARVGDLLRITLDNQLPADTSLHWHGLALPNGVDGAPGMTQNSIAPGGRHLYEFVAQRPGTYLYGAHVGVQLDRGLYASLTIADPAEPGDYDDEWIVVLDDWVDGTGRTPDDVLRALTATRPTTSAQTGSTSTAPFGDPGRVNYPYYLVNGALPAAPVSYRGRPGRRLRLRVINAASDTIFTLAVGGHRLTVTHADGFRVAPRETAALHIGQGERYDLLVNLGDGVFPLVARPWRRPGQAMALIRTTTGMAPAVGRLPEFTKPVLQATELTPDDSARLPGRPTDVFARLRLGGQADPYGWTINGAPFGRNNPITVFQGQRLQLDVTNATTSAHPLHLHGHTMAMPNGLRKDTVLIPPSTTIPLQLDATNPGAWSIHCQNPYHAETGMAIALEYR
ncbi:MAG: multicopper oxidase family protein [Actinobacteria bacterium]|jgi:FtsP/CotA-like multicopper oxidase with cupredoxin domain|uniref:multicopper oxidase family protein n=1 Tax=Propionicimonas sp. T2.31MG-18 TaxID=3157620 RepID=UPI0035E53A40|nr:multicopper oxidase family protein [Actinomycetota bacterium]